MPFDAMPRKPIAPEIASEIRLAYETLVRLEEFFDAGERWHRGELCDGHGRYCLIGAVDHLRCPDASLRYLVQVARARHGHCPFGNPLLAVMNEASRSMRRQTDFAESMMSSATSSAADPVTTNTFQQPADADTFSSAPASRWASCRSHNQEFQAARRVANGARRDRTG